MSSAAVVIGALRVKLVPYEKKMVRHMSIILYDMNHKYIKVALNGILMKKVM